MTPWCCLVETGTFDIHEVTIDPKRNSYRYAGQMLVLAPFPQPAEALMRYFELVMGLRQLDPRFYGVSQLQSRGKLELPATR